MSEVIVIDRDELNHIIENTARIAGAEGARLALSTIQKPIVDKINEDEAMQLLDCGSRTLASLRADRLITFYTTSRPFKYSRKSILEHIEFKKIKKVDL